MSTLALTPEQEEEHRSKARGLRSTYKELQVLERRLRQATTRTEQAAIRANIREAQKSIVIYQKEIVDRYDPRYTECRDIGHFWSVIDDGMNDSSDYWRTLECQRGCETKRHEVINRWGLLERRRYDHNPAYLLPVTFHARQNKAFWRGLQYMKANRKET